MAIEKTASVSDSREHELREPGSLVHDRKRVIGRQDAQCLRRCQALGQIQSLQDGQCHLQAALPLHRGLSLGLLQHYYCQAVCGQPDRLHPWQGHSRGCSKYLLLDSLYMDGS